MNPEVSNHFGFFISRRELGTLAKTYSDAPGLTIRRRSQKARAASLQNAPL